ncbi:MAG: DNA polymerase III subunit alpha [Dehalococcoidia bacterium]|nr:DNA polymerase III subunit alpha [Dehalococcoidia bacterium]MSQ35302.1 DNA polymerase III subunit alpha [Dehalococcoidia bacterium]
MWCALYCGLSRIVSPEQCLSYGSARSSLFFAPSLLRTGWVSGPAVFVHLHNHSEYSLLDGLSRIPDMVGRAAELTMPAIGLTDHGNVHGAVDFYKAAKAAGIKGIVGVEGYVASGSRQTKDPSERQPYHITMLAQTQAGYRNLLKLVTIGHLEGFYYRPRVDRETLEKYSEGIIVLSGCPSAEVSRRIQDGRMQDAREAIGWYRDVFKDRYYLELMAHDKVPGLTEVNKTLVQLSKETGVPLAVTHDTHYVRREDAPLQDILTCIQTNTNINDPKRLKFDDDSFYLKTPAEMAALWPELPQALKNTLVIAEQCNAGPELGKTYVPRYPSPDGLTSMAYLRKICAEGALRRFGTRPEKKYADRLAYELEVIEKTNFADYFLVVWDIFRFVNRKGILSAVRGSAAASLVLYCLDVTQIDPVATKLVFERFLNVERKEMPDIDMDFQDDRREEVIRYCVERYTREHVAQIITFGTLGAKAAVRDVARALNFDTTVGDRLARRIPPRLHMTLEQALLESTDLAGLVNTDDKSRQVMEIARKLEGAVRHASTHAAGVVISDQPLTNHVALQRSTSENEDAPPTTQFAMGPVADVGLLKMDFLGLKNLTILDRVLKLIEHRRGEKLSLTDVPTDEMDPQARAAYDVLSAAETFGVFQLESAGMRRYIKELKPSSVNDIAAMIALFRPGPMDHISSFIDSKHGRRPVTYPHPALKDILDETYGIIVYQDQVLLIAREFGGYTLGEADILRKAMGKKVPEIMAAQREKFTSGAVAKGYSQELATTMFNLIEPFAGYAFNKAHSMSYAMIAYWTAYFKANYPVEYFTAVLNTFQDEIEKVGEAVVDARRQKIDVLPPDLNYSSTEFTIETDGSGGAAIRFGLGAIKNVGVPAVGPVIATRESGGRFASLEDFCARMDFKGMNRRTIESLIKVGALDCFELPRGALLDAAERIITAGQRQARLRDSGQTTMFDLFGQSVQSPAPEIRVDASIKEPEHERSIWEKELLGVELTQSAFTRDMYAQPEGVIVFGSLLTPERAGERVSALGQVAAIRELSTRKGDRFISVNLALLDSQIELVVWPGVLETTADLWTAGRYVTLTGQVRERDGRVSISVETAREYVLPDAHAMETTAPAAPPAVRPSNPTTKAPVSASTKQPTPHVPSPTAASTAPRINNHPAEGPLVSLDKSAGNGHSSVPVPHVFHPPAPVAGDDPLELSLNTYPATAQHSTPVHSSDHASVVEFLPAGGIVVRVRETGQATEDRHRFEDLIRLLLEFRGTQPVRLEVSTKGRIVKLDLPFVSVNPIPELHARLADLLGTGGGAVSAASAS